MKLSMEEKAQVFEALKQVCGGTPLQPHAEFASQYLGHWAIGLIENRDEVFKGEKGEDNVECASK